MFLKGISVVFLTMLIGGCSSDSNSGGASTRTPLNAQQKNELKGFSQSVNNVGTAAGRANQKMRTNSRIQSVATQGQLEMPNARAPRNEKIDYMEGAMDQCHFANNVEDLFDPNNPQTDPNEILNRLEQGVYINVDGAQCPIDLDASAHLKINRQNGAISSGFALDLQIKDKSISNMSRVTSASLKGVMSGQASQSGSNANFTFNGEVNHKDKGIVKIAVVAASADSQSGNRSTATIVYSFKDFSAIGDIASITDYTSGQSTTEYALNGEKVSQEEFLAYFAGLEGGELNKIERSEEGHQVGPIDSEKPELPKEPGLPGIGMGSTFFSRFM